MITTRNKISSKVEHLQNLLSECVPEIQCRIKSLTSLWRGERVLHEIQKNECLLKRIKKELKNERDLRKKE